MISFVLTENKDTSSGKQCSSNVKGWRAHMVVCRMLLMTALFLTVNLVLAQKYSFSINKTGAGKQVLVFIPGFACSGDVWKETVDALKNNYTCYILTMAGFAGVEPTENPSFEAWKIEIAKFIQEENIEKPIIVGHSMGGGLALAVAADFPMLAKKVVVVDALPCLTALTNPNFKSNVSNDCSDAVNKFMAMPQEQFAQMQKMSVATLTVTTDKYNEIMAWGLQSDRRTYAKIYCDFTNTDLRERIKNIRIPSLILLEPPFKNIDDAIKEQYKNLPAAQIEYAQKGLHFIMFDDKEWYMQQFAGFVKN